MTETRSAASQAGTAAASSRLLLFAVLGGMFLAVLDQTIVGTALPRITSELAGADIYTWVVTAYLLTSTVTVPLYGRLSDTHGRKPLLLFGVSVFLVGSALCGLAQTIGQLVAFRAVQGIGAGALLPLSIALAMELYPPSQSSRLQGTLGAIMALSYLAGPFLGGVFTDHASWRWAFYVNVPIGLVLLAIIVVKLPHRGGHNRRARPDYLGIAVFTVAVTALLIGLTEKGLDGNNWVALPVIGPLVVAGVFVALFVLVEKRVAEPIVPMGLFRNKTYALVTVASFFGAFALYAGVVFLPRYFQEALGRSATESGMRLYPLMLGMALTSYVTGLLIARTRRYKVWLVFAPFPMLLGALLCAYLAVDTSTWALVLWMALLGVGIGPTMSGLTVAIRYAVPLELIGTASGNLTFFRQIGGAVALAIGGTVYSSVVAQNVSSHGPKSAHAEAAAAVIPWLGAAGAVIVLVAVVLLPGTRIPDE